MNEATEGGEDFHWRSPVLLIRDQASRIELVTI
jgi:hypothetical protein